MGSKRNGRSHQKQTLQHQFRQKSKPLSRTDNQPAISGPKDQGLLLGWEGDPDFPFGFAAATSAFKAKAASERQLLRYTGDAPLVTVAPTGSGKGRAVIIPNLLTNGRPAIVIDPKGELYHVTANARRRMGHRVVLLDPTGLIKCQSDRYNPLDLLSRPEVDREAECHRFAKLISGTEASLKDPFWDNSATGLLTAACAHLVLDGNANSASLMAIRDFLQSDDVNSRIMELIDNNQIKSPLARREFATYLNHAERDTRPSVLSTANSYSKCVMSDRVALATSETTFSLDDFIAGKPMTIYIVIPPSYLDSLGALLRIWLAGLMSSIMTRNKKVASRTMLYFDETAQVGNFPLLKRLVTLCRGYGLQTWMFFQDRGQLRTHYQLDADSIVNNCGVVQAFGFSNPEMMGAWSDFFQLRNSNPLSLRTGTQLLHVVGQYSGESRMLDYLKDPMFRALFDANPLCESDPEDPLEHSSRDLGI